MISQGKVINVLVVDDDKIDRERVRRLLSKSTGNYNVIEARTVDEGLKLYDKNNFDVILLDYRMPLRNGVEMILEIRTHLRNYGSAIIMLSSAEDEKLAIECLKAGAQDFITKSEVTVSRIQNALIHAQTRFELEKELRNSYLTSKMLAEKDALTGLANRFVFDEALQIAVANNGRSEFKLGLILFDIDNFKHINDIHGHDVGDSVLIEISLRIANALRENELFSRIGGDEFAIMITNLNSIYHLSDIASRIITAMDDPIKTDHASLQIELSVGIAIHPDNTVDSKELVKCSDIALYRAKTKQGSQICFFYPEMQEKLLRRYEIEKLLGAVIANDELVLFYQPILDVKTRRLKGFEALLRLDSKNGLESYPDEFIPISEQTGTMNDIGSWVIETAIKQLSMWNKQFSGDICMSINLSAVQLESDNFIEAIKSNIAKYNVIPSSLEFELTETALLNCSAVIVDKLKNIRKMGCKIALDDFGTGYSSISHLLVFPITTIKLDKSIMPASSEDSNSFVLVEALISMANILNLEMVAEGIEEEFQLSFIQKHQVQRAQGYLFNRPMPAKEVRKIFFL
jgi:diguanylate cyclase (GGDEF)-like protein